MSMRGFVTVFAVALTLAACERSPVDSVPGDSAAAMSILFTAPARPAAAPPAERITVWLAGPEESESTEEQVDTTLVGLPGDTVFFDDLRPGSYVLRMEGTVSLGGIVDPFIAWTTLDSVVVLPGIVTPVEAQPVSFEVDSVSTSSALPLPQGTPLELTWAPVPTAETYRIGWARSFDYGLIVQDTVTTGTSIAVDLGDPGVYYVFVAPRDTDGRLGYPVALPDSVEVVN